MTIQEICKKCGNQCCKVLHIPNTLEWDQKFIDARGIHQDNNVLIIPHICPQLENNKCKIYPLRPKPCKDFFCEHLLNILSEGNPNRRSDVRTGS